jgi:hypothetical protein
VWFAPPAGAQLVVRFDERPAARSLEVVRGDDSRAAAQVVARAGSEVLLVLPGELRVRNSRASTADYRVTLPSPVRRVLLHVGPGEAPARIIEVVRNAPQTIRLADSIATPPPGR